MISDSDKKLHQGWGGDEGTTELKQEEAAANDAAAEDPEATAAAATATAEGAEGARDDKGEGRPRREREPEEEDTTLTLDQYLAQKKEQDGNLPKIEATRQANDGAGDDLWKGATVLSKTEEDSSYFVGKVCVICSFQHQSSDHLFIGFPLHRPRTLPRPVARKKRRFSLKSMHTSIALTAEVVAVAVVVIEVIGLPHGALVAVAALVAAVRMAILLTLMLPMRLHSLPSPKSRRSYTSPWVSKE